MNKKQKGNQNTLLIMVCVLMTILVVFLSGMLLYFFLGSDSTPGSGGQQTESGQEESQTESEQQGRQTEREVDGELFYEGIEKQHAAFDEESGLQYADNQLLVTAAEGVTREEVEAQISSYGAEIVGMIEVTNLYQLQFPESYTKAELEEIGRSLCQSDQLESYEINLVMQTDVSATYPDDEEWKNDWNDSAPAGKNWGMEAIDAPEAWDYYGSMKEVNVGVYDNMFYDHTDLHFQEIHRNTSGDELNNSHGTHVSGTIGAGYNNGKGVCGVFPKAQIYGTSFVETEKQYGSMMGIRVEFTYLIHEKKCKVINMSVGWPELTFSAARGNEAAVNAIEYGAQQIGDYLETLFDLDDKNDFVICKAAGNDNSDYQFVRADSNDPGYRSKRKWVHPKT